MLELWFDFSCPYAYLASQKAPGLARAAGVELAWKPMLLGGVFRGIGAGDGPMATIGAAKAAHNLRDMQRWAAIFGVPLQMPAAHPMRTVRALRVLLGLPEARWGAAIAAIYAAYWQRAEDVTQDVVIEAALRSAGVPAAEIAAAVAGAETDAIKEALRRRTDEAIALGIFGAPAWILREPQRLIWGQDRLPWVEAALAGWDMDAAPAGGPRTFGRDIVPFESPHALHVYFDVSSPFAYFALTQLPALASVTGTTPVLHPILLGGLFRDIGQADVPLLAMTPAKLRYTSTEMQRWARWWGQPFAMPTKFPQRTIAAQRLCILAAEQGYEPGIRLATALARAMWAEQRDLEDPATLGAILDAQGLPRDWVERTADPAVKAALVRETTAAKDAGLFGVPSFVVETPGGNHAVWGQDRLDLVVRYLAGWEVP
ncbi:MAG: 2-hydroxychromene-2-carboxylate isomerase [Deltaproteobacteria bacterium]